MNKAVTLLSIPLTCSGSDKIVDPKMILKNVVLNHIVLTSKTPNNAKPRIMSNSNMRSFFETGFICCDVLVVNVLSPLEL